MIEIKCPFCEISFKEGIHFDLEICYDGKGKCLGFDKYVRDTSIKSIKSGIETQQFKKCTNTCYICGSRMEINLINRKKNKC